MHQWLQGNKRPPIKIDAELHRRCNLDCRFCSRRESNVDMTEESKKIEISKKRWLEIAEQSGKMGVRDWNISGIGEPMCKPDLTLSVMEKLKEYDIFGEITTNGTLWTEEMVKETVEMGWDSVCVSIDSPKKEVHNDLRQAKAFDGATRTLSLFKKWKKKLGSKKPVLTINAVLNNMNYLDIPELFLLGNDLGVDSIFVEPMIVYTEEGKKLKLDQDQIKEFKKIAEKCEEMGKRLGIEPNINCFTEDQEYEGKLVDKTSEMKEVIEDDSNKGVEDYKDDEKDYDEITDKILNIPCYYPWFYMIITADGSAAHCGEKVDKTENIKEKNLEKIWFSKDFQKTRERFLKNDLPDYCNRCRPNVVGDARRIRKSIIELRDKKYLLNAIEEAEYFNRTIEEKINLIAQDPDNLMQDENRKGEKEELEKLRKSSTYKIAKKISSNHLGSRMKNKIHSKLGTKLGERKERSQMEEAELRKKLMKLIERNKELKDRLYKMKEKKKIYQNLENFSQYRRELEEIKNSFSYSIKEILD